MNFWVICLLIQDCNDHIFIKHPLGIETIIHSIKQLAGSNEDLSSGVLKDAFIIVMPTQWYNVVNSGEGEDLSQFSHLVRKNNETDVEYLNLLLQKTL